MMAANTQLSASNPRKAKKGSQNRRKSREIALKAVYRGMINTSAMQQILRDMQDDPDYHKADEAYFKQLLLGVTEKTATLDAQIATLIDRKLTELSPIEHAVLRVSTYEMLFDTTIPYRVVINEGVELAKIYGGIDGYKFINGVLDKLAAAVRPHEFKKAV